MKPGQLDKEVYCPLGHDPMTHRHITKTVPFRGMEIPCRVEAFICSVCGLEAGTGHSAGAIQKQLADTFRKRMGDLPGEEFKRLRKMGLTGRA